MGICRLSHNFEYSHRNSEIGVTISRYNNRSNVGINKTDPTSILSSAKASIIPPYESFVVHVLNRTYDKLKNGEKNDFVPFEVEGNKNMNIFE